MSYFNAQKLRGLLDQSLSFFTTVQAFTTSPLTIDSLTQFQAYIKAFRIVNQDGTNVLTYVQGQLTEPSKTVPISSEVVSTAWESFIKLTPNAVSGKGFIEMDLVPRSVAELPQ